MYSCTHTHTGLPTPQKCKVSGHLYVLLCLLLLMTILTYGVTSVCGSSSDSINNIDNII